MDSAMRIVRGTPTPEELAALVGTLHALSRRTPAARQASATSAWALSARPAAATGLRPGPDAWRLSAFSR